MAAIAVTYTFSNGTTSDASQVNQNFTDIINGLSDGTKDISVNAVTAAGNLSASGNTTLGNASSDTITFTGSQASHLNPSAHNTYDFGTVTTLGYRAFYFASSSATKTAKVLGPAISSDIILTLPAYTGTLRNIPSVIASQTATYAILASDEFIPVSASGGAFTVTLPTAVGATGKVYTIKRTDQTLANLVTIATTSSQTIDGVTTTNLATQYESVEIVSDGSNWHILRRHIDRNWTSFTPTCSWTSNVSTPEGKWRRVGDSADFQFNVTSTGSTGPGATNLTFDLPSGMTIDTAKLLLGANSSSVMGSGQLRDGGTTSYLLLPYYSSTTQLQARVVGASATYGTLNTVTVSVPVTFDSGDTAGFNAFSIPITNWKG